MTGKFRAISLGFECSQCFDPVESSAMHLSASKNTKRPGKFLAFFILNSFYQLQQKGIHYHWKTVRKIMRSRIRVTTQANMENGRILYHRSSSKAEGEQGELYKALGLSSQILGARKTIL